MGSGQPVHDELTLPPYSARQGQICPRCHRQLTETSAAFETHGPYAIARCPEHGLAFVNARELVESGGDPLLGTKVAGRFTVLSRIGAGSMGAVYRARQEAVGRDVAIKIVRRERAYDAETKARFEREARATSQLVSPHTVTVFDFGEAEDGSWFLAMELLMGETLGDRLRRLPRLAAHDTVRIAREVLRSLSEAHGKGIVHRDLKPDNVFLTLLPGESGVPPTEIVKVLDFGIAKLVRDEKRVDQLETQAGTVFGTPRYMSPEQAQGNPLDSRSDLYSLGVIIYQMLAGRAPFVDDDAVVVMARHIKDTPPTFAELSPELRVPPPLEAVVRRALSKQADDRPQSAELFGGELDAALEQAGVLASGVHATSWAGPTSTIRTVVARPHRPFLYAGLGVAVLVLFVGGFFAVRALVDGRSPAPASASATAPDLAEPELGAAASASQPAGSVERSPAPVASDARAAAAAPKKRALRPKAVRPAEKKPAAAPTGTPAPRATDSHYGRFE
jgi:eukaryotic-like serine/threonine-protein kinase